MNGRRFSWIILLGLFHMESAGQESTIPPITESGPVGLGPIHRTKSNAQAEFNRYLRNTAALRNHHDSDGINSGSVVKTLLAAGIGAPAASGFRPFHIPVFKGSWRWPLRAGIVSSEYGWRWGRNHDGIDVAADPRVPVFAAAPGKVIYAGNGLAGYGNAVIVRHDQKTTSLYAHNSSITVRAGEDVKQGRILAYLGSTGRSTGPHVHFEIRINNKAVDPRRFLPKKPRRIL